MTLYKFGDAHPHSTLLPALHIAGSYKLHIISDEGDVKIYNARKILHQFAAVQMLKCFHHIEQFNGVGVIRQFVEEHDHTQRELITAIAKNIEDGEDDALSHVAWAARCAQWLAEKDPWYAARGAFNCAKMTGDTNDRCAEIELQGLVRWLKK